MGVCFDPVAVRNGDGSEEAVGRGALAQIGGYLSRWFRSVVLMPPVALKRGGLLGGDC